MLAYFYKGNHVGIWQEQAHEDTWVERTAASLGHILADVEVFRVRSIRSDTPYFFDENKNLVVQEGTQEVLVNGVTQIVTNWSTPEVLERVYPKP